MVGFLLEVLRGQQNQLIQMIFMVKNDDKPQLHTEFFLFKFLSLANNSKIYQPTEWPKKKKTEALENFFEQNYPLTLPLLSRRGPTLLTLLI